MSEEEKQAIRDTANSIIEALGEKNQKARNQIHHLTKLCGIEFVQQLLADTQKFEADKGLPTMDGKRRRTPGGTFFYLAKSRVSEEIKLKVWPHYQKRKQKATEKAEQETTSS